MNDIQSLIDSLTSLRDGGEIPQAERDGYWLALRSAEQRLIVAVESAICREKGGFVVDPLPDFEKARNEAQPLFRDIVHKTCFGDSVLALSVYNSIKDKVADLYTQKKHAR